MWMNPRMAIKMKRWVEEGLGVLLVRGVAEVGSK
jgi:hypothetical protein